MNAKELGGAHAYPSPMGDMGLTKRELFAAMAMRALMSDKTNAPEALRLAKAHGIKPSNAMAIAAVSAADALLAELAKEQTP